MDNIIIEDAHLILKNFSGKAGKYNAEGNRNFGVLLSDDVAAELESQGWSVKHYMANVGTEDEHNQAWLKVKVHYGSYPPNIYKITSNGKRELSEDNLDQLDWQRFSNVDLVISPYEWTVNGRTGVAAYLRTAYFTIAEDVLAGKYSDIPDL